REAKAAEAGQYYQDSLPILYEHHNAEQAFQGHQRDDGSLKGRSLGLFGYTLFRTKARRQAEEAAARAHNARLRADQVEYTRRAYDRDISSLDLQAQRAEDTARAQVAALERHFGTDKDFELAEDLMKRSINDVALVVGLEDARAAYGAQQITEDEYRAFLLHAG